MNMIGTSVFKLYMMKIVSLFERAYSNTVRICQN